MTPILGTSIDKITTGTRPIPVDFIFLTLRGPNIKCLVATIRDFLACSSCSTDTHKKWRGEYKTIR